MTTARGDPSFIAKSFITGRWSTEMNEAIDTKNANCPFDRCDRPVTGISAVSLNSLLPKRRMGIFEIDFRKIEYRKPERIYEHE